jgi:hypothetical protein
LKSLIFFSPHCALVNARLSSESLAALV